MVELQLVSKLECPGCRCAGLNIHERCLSCGYSFERFQPGYFKKGELRSIEKMSKTKVVSNIIEDKYKEIKKLKLIQSKFPDAEISIIEDGSKQFLSYNVMSKIAGFWFYVQNNRIYMRAYATINGKTPTHVYSASSYGIPIEAAANMLNMSKVKSIMDLPIAIQNIIGKVIEG